MARGNIAKEAVEKKIQAAFGADYIGIYDKKIYIWAQENGERLQIAISLTCPKTPVAVSTAPVVRGDRMDFESDTVIVPTESANVEVSEEERQTIADLMARLGL